MSKKAIQLGAGNIGRGFIGALLSQAGYHVIFADVNQEILDKINEDKTYTIHVMDVECSKEVITNISAMNSNDEALVNEIAESEILTTAVGLTVLKFVAPTIAKGIALRHQNGSTQYLNVIACENAVRGSSVLKDLVYEQLTDEVKAYANTYIGFPDCSVDRIVPPVKSENIIDVVVERYYEWNVEEKSFKGEIPKITGMNLAGDLLAYIERKLFTLNTGHAITSYLGNLKGYATVDESINDKTIYSIVKLAMTESGNGLVEKHGLDKEAHAKYIDKIIARFKNHYLQDDVGRVGREPLRKLSAGDRLVNPMLTAYNNGLPVEYLMVGAGAALNYVNETDGQAVELQEKIASLGIEKALKEITGIEDEYLLERITANYNLFKNKKFGGIN